MRGRAGGGDAGRKVFSAYTVPWISLLPALSRMWTAVRRRPGCGEGLAEEPPEPRDEGPPYWLGWFWRALAFALLIGAPRGWAGRWLCGAKGPGEVRREIRSVLLL